jgi:hypothetical protein
MYNNKCSYLDGVRFAINPIFEPQHTKKAQDFSTPGLEYDLSKANSIINYQVFMLE